MAWTTPRTYITGELVTSAMLNTHIRDNLNYLYAGGEGGVASGSISLPNDTYTSLSWAGTGYGAVAVGTTGITIAVAGVYSVTVTGAYAANNTASRLTLIQKNGAGVLECGHPCCVKASVGTVTTDTIEVTLAASDLISAQFRQDIGGALTVTGYMIVRRLGA